MKIPNKIKVLGQWYQVTDIGDGDINNMGQVFLGKNIIEIRREMPQSKQESTLIHELIEIFNDRFCLNLKHSAITMLEEGLYATLTDNHLLKE